MALSARLLVVDNYNVVDPVTVFLSAGPHTVDVLLREDGTQLDSISLELN